MHSMYKKHKFPDLMMLSSERLKVRYFKANPPPLFRDFFPPGDISFDLIFIFNVSLQRVYQAEHFDVLLVKV